MYSSFGGIKSVIATDVFQFAILIIVIPLVYMQGVHELGDITQLSHFVPASRLSLNPNGEGLHYFSLFLVFLIAFSPSTIQRLLITKNIKQAIIATRWTGFILFPFIALVGIIGLCALSINPELDPNLALPFMIREVLPIGMKGFAIAGMLSVIMSTADSELNVASVAFIHDILKPLRKSKMTQRAEFLTARAVSLILGISTILIAVIVDSL